jgi:hypothetical protein
MASIDAPHVIVSPSSAVTLMVTPRGLERIDGAMVHVVLWPLWTTVADGDPKTDKVPAESRTAKSTVHVPYFTPLDCTPTTFAVICQTELVGT